MGRPARLHAGGPAAVAGGGGQVGPDMRRCPSAENSCGCLGAFVLLGCGRREDVRFYVLNEEQGRGEIFLILLFLNDLSCLSL